MVSLQLGCCAEKYSNYLAVLLSPHFHFFLRPVASIVMKVRGVVCVEPSNASSFNHRTCLDRQRVSLKPIHK